MEKSIKKSSFVAMILGTVSGVLFALGMCMTLLPEWNAFTEGIIFGAVGLLLGAITLFVWRKMKTQKVLKLSYYSLFLNLLYSIYNCIIGFSSHSWWFITMSAYYTILSVMRFAVLHIEKKSDNGESPVNFVKKFVGVMFMLLAVILAGIAYLSVHEDRGIKHNEIVMITIALYSSIKITLAVINLVKSGKGSSAIIKTLRNISFADALVSIFALQRSMLVSFEGMQAGDIMLFNILTGTAVYILVFILGINLIYERKIFMAKSKIVKANEKIAEKVVGGYKKIENAVVGGYTKIEDKFVDMYLTKDGETVEQAKERLKKK